jgi:hypothetical protein
MKSSFLKSSILVAILLGLCQAASYWGPGNGFFPQEKVNQHCFHPTMQDFCDSLKFHPTQVESILQAGAIDVILIR